MQTICHLDPNSTPGSLTFVMGRLAWPKPFARTIQCQWGFELKLKACKRRTKGLTRIEARMSSDSKKPGNGAGAAAGGGGGFGARLNHYLYSGEKKHVAAGIAIIGVLFGIPWYLKNRGFFCLFFQNFLGDSLLFYPTIGNGVKLAS